jgi:hypothetical protein
MKMFRSELHLWRREEGNQSLRPADFTMPSAERKRVCDAAI